MSLEAKLPSNLDRQAYRAEAMLSGYGQALWHLQSAIQFMHRSDSVHDYTHAPDKATMQTLAIAEKCIKADLESAKRLSDSANRIADEANEAALAAVRGTK